MTVYLQSSKEQEGRIFEEMVFHSLSLTLRNQRVRSTSGE